MIYSDLGLIPLVIDKVSCQLSRQIQFQLNQRNLVSAQCDLIQTANIHGKKYFDERFFIYFLFHRWPFNSIANHLNNIYFNSEYHADDNDHDQDFAEIHF